ncbi:hypothetical protein A3D84_04660 [Candidatus Woesebacteria bacterium RIFCSPHIGHO2_02_FULL_42_20]|nr:MAG: hypothetical protein A3D84_04660 [Candidatus Woesebacteria bacterium RIFCSPHIGHO2_02_FULL_42_20]OGM67368.1 MAG: hypothetical protein A2969_02915 [Candidatus Woesebacteria bacterium RIFCSPLOWO2_01_FULL_42_67]
MKSRLFLRLPYDRPTKVVGLYNAFPVFCLKPSVRVSYLAWTATTKLLTVSFFGYPDLIGSEI